MRGHETEYTIAVDGTVSVDQDIDITVDRVDRVEHLESGWDITHTAAQ